MLKRANPPVRVSCVFATPACDRSGHLLRGSASDGSCCSRGAQDACECSSGDWRSNVPGHRPIRRDHERDSVAGDGRTLPGCPRAPRNAEVAGRAAASRVPRGSAPAAQQSRSRRTGACARQGHSLLWRPGRTSDEALESRRGPSRRVIHRRARRAPPEPRSREHPRRERRGAYPLG